MVGRSAQTNPPSISKEMASTVPSTSRCGEPPLDDPIVALDQLRKKTARIVPASKQVPDAFDGHTRNSTLAKVKEFNHGSVIQPCDIKQEPPPCPPDVSKRLHDGLDDLLELCSSGGSYGKILELYCSFQKTLSQNLRNTFKRQAALEEMGTAWQHQGIQRSIISNIYCDRTFPKKEPLPSEEFRSCSPWSIGSSQPFTPEAQLGDEAVEELMGIDKSSLGPESETTPAPNDAIDAFASLEETSLANSSEAETGVTPAESTNAEVVPPTEQQPSAPSKNQTAVEASDLMKEINASLTQRKAKFLDALPRKAQNNKYLQRWQYKTGERKKKIQRRRLSAPAAPQPIAPTIRENFSESRKRSLAEVDGSQRKKPKVMQRPSRQDKLLQAMAESDARQKN